LLYLKVILVIANFLMYFSIPIISFFFFRKKIVLFSRFRDPKVDIYPSKAKYLRSKNIDIERTHNSNLPYPQKNSCFQRGVGNFKPRTRLFMFSGIQISITFASPIFLTFFDHFGFILFIFYVPCFFFKKKPLLSRFSLFFSFSFFFIFSPFFPLFMP